MSRSKRKPIIKERPRNYKKSSYYWRTIRRIIKSKVKYLGDDIDNKVLPNPKEITDDWDYSDYRFDFRFSDNEDLSEKYGRK